MSLGMSMGFVYILQLSNGKYYVGSTKKIEQRIFDHKRGHTKYTKGKDPELIFQKEFVDYTIARKREMYIKSCKKKSVIEKILEGSFVWQ